MSFERPARPSSWMIRCLPDSFAKMAIRVATYPYVKEGTDQFLKTFGPAQYHSAAEYDAVVGQPLGQPIIGTETLNSQFGDVTITQRKHRDRSRSTGEFLRRRASGLMDAYLETMDRLHLDGYVYPAIQMPPVDETMAQNGRLSEGPHSDTSWVNMLGVPAVVVVGGFYPGGCPSGSRSRHGRGTMATCWGTPMPMSRQPTTGIRRCWSSRGFSRKRLEAVMP